MSCSALTLGAADLSAMMAKMAVAQRVSAEKADVEAAAVVGNVQPGDWHDLGAVVPLKNKKVWASISRTLRQIPGTSRQLFL
jgi:hypothetical protein